MLMMMSQFWSLWIDQTQKKQQQKKQKKIHIRTCFLEWAKNYRIQIAKITKLAITSINL